jgi:quinol monooxygenase YgiN
MMQAKLAQGAMGLFIGVIVAAAAGCASHKHERLGNYGAVPRGAYAVVAEIRAKPGMEDALREATLPLVKDVRAERNNIVYFLHEDREMPGRFVFYEIFATKADFEAHNATEHVQRWFRKLPELAQGEVKVMHLEILGN